MAQSIEEMKARHEAVMKKHHKYVTTMKVLTILLISISVAIVIIVYPQISSSLSICTNCYIFGIILLTLVGIGIGLIIKQIMRGAKSYRSAVHQLERILDIQNNKTGGQ